MSETTLRATSEKLWPLACRIFGAPRSSSAKERGEEVFNSHAAFIGAQIATRGFALTVLDAQHVARLVKRRAQRGEPLVLHQHQEMLLRQIGGR